MKTQIIKLLVFLFFYPILISAQRPVTSTLEDSIRCETAICSSDKFIWIGTNKGLIQRNIRTGKEWILTDGNSDLPSNVVTCIVCMAGGQTYIGTTNGILIWDNYAFLIINAENSELPDNYIQEMFLDNKENIWIRTKDCQMLKGTGRYVKSFKLPPSKIIEEVINSDPGSKIIR